MSKIVLITGASSGFGEACARTYAHAGYSLVLAARNIDLLSTLSKQLAAQTTVFCEKVDVRNVDSITHFFDSLPIELRAIDILINNAGLALGTEPAHEANLDDWENMIDTNIKGLVRITRHVLRNMVARNSGHIVNVGSIAGSWPYPGGNVYGATKSFVKQFSRGLRADVLGKNIRVTNIEPGMSETNFSRVRMKGDDEKAANVYKGTKPLSAQDIAESIFWATSVPEHVNINSLEIMPTCQAWGPLSINREMTDQ